MPNDDIYAMVSKTFDELLDAINAHVNAEKESTRAFLEHKYGEKQSLVVAVSGATEDDVCDCEQCGGCDE